VAVPDLGNAVEREPLWTVELKIATSPVDFDMRGSCETISDREEVEETVTYGFLLEADRYRDEPWEAAMM